MQVQGGVNKLALEADKGVWSEKPLADTYAECWAMLDLARQQKAAQLGRPAIVNSTQFAFKLRGIQD